MIMASAIDCMHSGRQRNRLPAACCKLVHCLRPAAALSQLSQPGPSHGALTQCAAWSGRGHCVFDLKLQGYILVLEGLVAPHPSRAWWRLTQGGGGGAAGNPSTESQIDNTGRIEYWHQKGLISSKTRAEVYAACDLEEVGLTNASAVGCTRADGVAYCLACMRRQGTRQCPTVKAASALLCQRRLHACACAMYGLHAESSVACTKRRVLCSGSEACLEADAETLGACRSS